MRRIAIAKRHATLLHRTNVCRNRSIISSSASSSSIRCGDQPLRQPEPPSNTDSSTQHVFIKPFCITRQFSSLPTPSSNSSLSQAHQNNENDPYANLVPIDYTTSSQISGEESQILEVQLLPNQMLRAESGAMLYMTEGVQMQTSMGLGGGNSGGLATGLTRMMTGQNLMISDFTYTKEKGSGTVALGTDFPAKILKFTLNNYPGMKLICQKGAYLAGSHSVQMEMAFTKSFTSGFFGGEGFILQSLQGTTNNNVGGEETVFLKAYGTVVKKEIKEGESLRVSSGSLVCMTSTIDYDVTTMSGFKNVMFGGEGLFVTTLSGPGTVWLQGMPVDRMVSEIARKIPSGGGIGLGIPIMGGGGGGAEGSGEGAADVAAGEVADGGPADTEVPMTDAAMESDRNATVASSGMTEPSSDPESSESLFGDAAYGGGSASEQNDTASSSSTISSDEDSFSTTDDFSSQSNESMNMPKFEEPTMVDEQFEDDGTKFSTYEGDGDGSTDIGESAGSEMPTTDEEGSGLLSQLWDFFRDFTDDD